MSPKQLRLVWLSMRAEKNSALLAALNDTNSTEIIAEAKVVADLHKLIMDILSGLPDQ